MLLHNEGTSGWPDRVGVSMDEYRTASMVGLFYSVVTSEDLCTIINSSLSLTVKIELFSSKEKIKKVIVKNKYIFPTFTLLECYI